MVIVIANKTHADKANVALVNKVSPQNITKSRQLVFVFKVLAANKWIEKKQATINKAVAHKITSQKGAGYPIKAIIGEQRDIKMITMPEVIKFIFLDIKFIWL